MEKTEKERCIDNSEISKKNIKQKCDPNRAEIGVRCCFSVLTLRCRRLFRAWVCEMKWMGRPWTHFGWLYIVQYGWRVNFDYSMRYRSTQRGDKITALFAAATNQLRAQMKSKVICIAHASASALKRDNSILLIWLRHHRRRHYHWLGHARSHRHGSFPFTNRSTSHRTQNE